MKLELLSVNELQVTLDKKDLNELGITFEDLGYDNIKAKNFYKNIFKKARESKGFDARDCVLNPVPQDDGGCLLLITKRDMFIDLDDEIDHVCPYQDLNLDFNLNLNEIFSEINSYYEKTSDLLHVFEFNTFDDLIDACAVYTRMEENPDFYPEIMFSSIYSINNKYYLYFIPYVSYTYEIERYEALVMAISEFGRKIDPVMLNRFDEYGKILIRDNAFEIITKKFLHNTDSK